MYLGFKSLFRPQEEEGVKNDGFSPVGTI